MKRPIQTLLACAAMVAVATPALAIGEKKKEERFAVTSATLQTHRTDNTAAISAAAPKIDKKDAVFAIGLESLKWIGATSRQVGVPYPELWCADFINFILRRTGHATTNSRAAKSFLDYGKRIDQPRVGAIVVLTRGRNGGHVGIVRGTDGAGNIIVISRQLAAARLPASRLELEITEAVLIRDDESTLAILHQLRKLGVRIGMDDFGTGYSSLSYLQRFPFDKIKIDRSFIKDVAEKDGSHAIVQAVINIAKSRDITTTAEGVETEQQLSSLRALDCTEMQGWLFSPAIPSADLKRLFASYRERERGVA